MEIAHHSQEKSARFGALMTPARFRSTKGVEWLCIPSISRSLFRFLMARSQEQKRLQKHSARVGETFGAIVPGLELIRTLQDYGIHQGIEVHMEHTVITLLKDCDCVVGAFGYDRERGLFKVFKAKAIILATGGIGRAHRITSNSWEYTGDGQSLAYHAGAELIDMEFVQFHPTGMIWPPSVMGILWKSAQRRITSWAGYG
jgi:succinate dehydrogenase/fumarate reductase flavoprotein subunit